MKPLWETKHPENRTQNETNKQIPPTSQEARERFEMLTPTHQTIQRGTNAAEDEANVVALGKRKPN